MNVYCKPVSVEVMNTLEDVNLIYHLLAGVMALGMVFAPFVIIYVLIYSIRDWRRKWRSHE